MVILTHHSHGATGGLDIAAANNPLTASASTHERHDLLRQAIQFDSASQAAQEYWQAIERAQADRPDLMETLVQTCVRHNMSLEDLYGKAAEPQALTMYLVIAGARAEWSNSA